jgi:hypothetical protein
MKAKTVKEVLVAAHWILSHYEWVQHLHTKYPSYTDEGRLDLNKPIGFCLIGAVDAVEILNEDWNLLVQPLHVEAFRLLRNVIMDARLASWNDQKGRTKKQVLEALDQAIERAT